MVRACVPWLGEGRSRNYGRGLPMEMRVLFAAARFSAAFFFVPVPYTTLDPKDKE